MNEKIIEKIGIKADKESVKKSMDYIFKEPTKVDIQKGMKKIL